MSISALGDQPLSTVARWVSSPGERGTFNIVSDCVLTLVLCVWTSVHLNIPRASNAGRPGKKKTGGGGSGQGVGESEAGVSFPWKKMKYVVLSLIMPEVTAAIAFNQWLEQRSLMKFINKETDLGAEEHHRVEELQRIMDEEVAAAAVAEPQPSRPTPTSFESQEQHVEKTATHIPEANAHDDQRVSPSSSVQHRLSPWTTLHGWYAIMGGFTITTTSSSSTATPFPFPNGNRSLTLTSDAVKLLAKHHPEVFPRILASEIADKSKSSELAKLIVCTQITWFIINTIGRVAQGLPLTVLELNTAAHCICTFVTYALWWHKPLDIVQPSVVTLTKDAESMVAQMCIRSPEAQWLLREDELRLDKSRWQRLKGYLNNSIGNATELYEGAILIISPRDVSTFRLCVMEDEATHVSRWLRVHVRTREGEGDAAASEDGRLKPSELERATYETSNARTRILDFDEILKLLRLADAHAVANPALDWSHSPFCVAWVTRENPNHPFSNIKAIAVGTSGLSFISACTLYALVHGFAWNGPFRSPAELVLWRMGVLAFVPLSLLTPIIFVAAWRYGDSYANFVAGLGQSLRKTLERNGRQALKLLGGTARGTELPMGKVPYCALVSIPFYLLQVPIFTFRVVVSRATILFYFAFALLGFLTGRAFLVVEAFLALPYAPDDAFVLPNWSAYLPHFG